MAVFNNSTTLTNLSSCSNFFRITDLSSKSELIVIGVTQLLVALFCVSTVTFLLIRVKKKLWDTAAKRFSLSLSLCFTLSFLNNAALFFSIPYSFSKWYIAYVFINFCLLTAYDLYLTASLVSLLLQTGSPVLPKMMTNLLTPTQQYITEAAIQILILLLSLANLTPLINNSDYYHDYFETGCGSFPTYGFLVLCIILSCSVVVLCLTSAVLGFFFLKFIHSQSNRITRRIINVIVKLGFLLFGTLSLIVCDFITFTVYEVLSQSTPFTVLFAIVNIIFLTSLMILNYPSLDIWCFCLKNQSSGSTHNHSLFDTEGQETNPKSVWDHKNVPSYTTPYYPPEMSDCIMD